MTNAKAALMLLPKITPSRRAEKATRVKRSRTDDSADATATEFINYHSAKELLIISRISAAIGDALISSIPSITKAPA